MDLKLAGEVNVLYNAWDRCEEKQTNLKLLLTEDYICLTTEDEPIKVKLSKYVLKSILEQQIDGYQARIDKIKSKIKEL